MTRLRSALSLPLFGDLAIGQARTHALTVM
jgi:hypothetical protein